MLCLDLDLFGAFVLIIQLILCGHGIIAVRRELLLNFLMIVDQGDLLVENCAQVLTLLLLLMIGGLTSASSLTSSSLAHESGLHLHEIIAEAGAEEFATGLRYHGSILLLEQFIA